MNIYKYILFAITLVSFTSCFEDESTDATNPISEIIINESNLEKVYNLPKNDTLRIEPKVTQTNKELPLSYVWELNQEIVSTDKNFCYVGETLGTFNGRLIVENEDGKAFFTFTLNVNSPYEYGITVLSKDTDNRPHISFMQETMKEGDVSSFYMENCLEKNNPEQFFASNPSDIVQTKGSLIVACQGNNSDDDGAAIYFLNEKTFVMENIVETKEYKTFKPTKLFTPSESYDGVDYPVLSTDGKIYSLPTYNAVLQPSHKLLSTYAQTGFVVGESASQNDIIVWDKEVNGLVLIYNNYGPYYCGKKYLLERDSLLTDTEYTNKFKPLQNIRKLLPIHLTSEQKRTSKQELLVIADNNKNVLKAKIATFFWEPVAGSYGKYNLLDNGGFKVANKSKKYSLINENTPCIANATYQTMLFPDGNKVMRWFYWKAELENVNHYLENADVLLTVGSDDAIITSFEISDDHMKTYVAFYEPNQEGKNGSVWVFETNTGKVLEQYDNVCYLPVKMIYKKK